MQHGGEQLRRSTVHLVWSTWTAVAAEIRTCGDWWIRSLAWISLTIGLGGLCAVGALVALSGLGAPSVLIAVGCLAGFAFVTLAWVAAWMSDHQAAGVGDGLPKTPTPAQIDAS